MQLLFLHNLYSNYIPLRGCIKVAARGLIRTKVPCDYVMRLYYLLMFDMVPRCKGHGLLTKNLVYSTKAYSARILRAKEMFF